MRETRKESVGGLDSRRRIAFRPTGPDGRSGDGTRVRQPLPLRSNATLVHVKRLLLILVLAAGLAAIAYAFLGRGEPRRPRPLPEQEAAPEPTTSILDTPIPAPAAFGTLVVRLRPPEGAELPAKATAGYRRYGVNRLRPAAADGTYRFSDAPIGVVDAIADVEGYESDPVTVTLVSGTPTEAVIVLRPISPLR